MRNHRRSQSYFDRGLEEISTRQSNQVSRHREAQLFCRGRWVLKVGRPYTRPRVGERPADFPSSFSDAPRRDFGVVLINASGHKVRKFMRDAMQDGIPISKHVR